MAEPAGGGRAPARPRLLARIFYSASPETVARGLLGKLLVRPATPSAPEKLAGRIVEVEAYFGGEDPAAHAFAGRTARNAVLFGPPGHAYVYFIYGMHSCLNVSCGPEGQPGCVLLRALEPMAGMETMARRRWPGAEPAPRRARSMTSARALGLTSGPGRLCRAFAVSRTADNGADFTSRLSRLQIQDDSFLAGEVIVTPRVGIRKAADRLARYFLAGNPHVSRVSGLGAASLR